MKGIADTGFLVAFANRHDDHHDWAVDVAGQLDGPLLTCEPVLAECAFHLRDAVVTLDMIREGLVAVSLDVAKELPHLRALAVRYRDRHPDLADLCVIRLSELHPTRSVLTVDEGDFRIYRRNKRDTIPLVVPPKSTRR